MKNKVIQVDFQIPKSWGKVPSSEGPDSRQQTYTCKALHTTARKQAV